MYLQARSIHDFCQLKQVKFSTGRNNIMHVSLDGVQFKLAWTLHEQAHILSLLDDGGMVFVKKWTFSDIIMQAPKVLSHQGSWRYAPLGNL